MWECDGGWVECVEARDLGARVYGMCVCLCGMSICGLMVCVSGWSEEV
jgi:hypothetical protein